MSATIKWEPVTRQGRTLDASASFYDKLIDLLGDTNVIFDASHLLLLQGFKVGLSDKLEKEAVQEILSALETFGSVKVWREY